MNYIRSIVHLDHTELSVLDWEQPMDLYQQIFFSTLAVAFSILHGFLYFYNPRLKSNLYFAIFLLLYAFNIFFDFQSSFVSDPATELILIRIHRAVMPFISIFTLLFLYSVFDFKVSRQFWLLSASLIIAGGLAVYKPNDNFIYILLLQFVILIEALRIFIKAIHEKKDAARSIVTGFLFMFLFSGYDLMLDLNLMQPVLNINNGYPFGFGLLIISISMYLAKNYAKINQTVLEQKIKTQEMEINERLLKAENARKSIELEEARKIQLSMLPHCLPDLKGLDICFDMRTASEVGGDYYDYLMTDEGELIIAIGDATGHGMRAGLMVSIIKSLFITHAQNMGITDFFQKATWTIKQMNLNNLFMSLMLVKLKEGHITFSSAGMPPLYIYRVESNQIEELVVKGMPLGAFDSFSYQTIETDLNPGDTFLLMSDGFPELFNDKNEILDNERTKELFAKVAVKPANDIVNHLFAAGDEWRNGRSIQDDITFVVCKSKPGSE